MNEKDYKVVKGFDELEQSGPYSWHWAVEREAAVMLVNEEQEVKEYHVGFTIGVPPGVKERKVSILLDGIRIKEVLATQYCQLSIEVKAESERCISFATEEELVTVKGDSRQFAFQLFDFKVEILECYQATVELKNIQKIQMDLLRKAVGVCEKYGLKYYLIYGSLLGAVRHKGVIPWDDDIDIAMFREDFDKLIEISQTEFNGKYFLQALENQKHSFYGGYAKLRNAETTTFEPYDGTKCRCQGIGIDIFPLDGLSEDAVLRRKDIRKLRTYQKLLFIKCYGRCEANYWGKNIRHWYLYSVLIKFFRWQRLLEAWHKIICEIENEKSNFVCILTRFMDTDNMQFYRREDFGEGILVPFEDMELRIPDNYLYCIKLGSGDSFMQYPPNENRYPHHHAIFVDSLRPYREYQKRIITAENAFKTELKPVLYGTEKIYLDFLNKCGKVKPAFIIDTSGKSQGRFLADTLVVSNEYLKRYRPKDIQIIICSENLKESQKELQELGYNDYKIYVGVNVLS